MARGEDEGLALELEQLRARYRAMVEQAPDAIVVFDVEEGRFIEVNFAACELFGMGRSELLQTGPAQMSPPVQPDGRPSEQAARGFIELATRGEVQTFDWMHQSADGEPRPCRIQLTRVELAGQQLVRGMLQDVRAQRGAEAARDRFRRILDATTDFVGIADARGRSLYINPAMRRALRLPEDTRGQQIASYHPPPSARMVMEVGIPAAIRDGVWEGETEFLATDGRCIPTSQVLIAHLDDAGEPDYFSTIARDLSERRILERQALEAQKLDSLGRMAGGVAHDFNNILFGILGNLSLLAEDTTLETGAAESLAAAIRATHRAADLAREMLAYSGRAQIEPELIRLPELVADVEGLLAAAVPKKVQIRFDFAPDLPPVRGDPTQLRQVLMNLVLNAAEAIGEAEGEVTIRACMMGVDPQANLHSYLDPDMEGRECLSCEVSDSGPGMAPDVAGRVFDPFFSTKPNGRGLGLAAVLGIMKAHRGAIALRTAPGQGTTFRLSLPAAVGAATEPAAVTAAPTSVPWRGSGLVLIIDDEPVVRRIVRRTVERCGFSVIEAGDGTVGLETARQRVSDLAAVILDLTMPGLDGHEVLRALGDFAPDLPVILMSGYSKMNVPDGSVFLEKPFASHELAGALQIALERA